jgi:cyclic pyranopterin phosphate synthase
MDDILTYEEIFAITRAAVEAGVTKIRLTGGEPLMRKDMLQLCEWISAMEQIDDLAVTTNGVLLGKMAGDLKNAGVRRVNVSLDTLRRDRFAEITGRNELDRVLQGIAKAAEVGLDPVKINVVPMQGVNDDEIVDLARWTLSKPFDVRFIELMPTAGWARDRHHELLIPVDDIRRRVESIGPLEPASDMRTRGPATYARLPGARGRIGFIAAMSHHFCDTCNRLRLTADGKLRACLFAEEEVDIATPLRKGADIEALKAIIRSTVEAKPQRHHLNDRHDGRATGREMRAIGG